MSTTRSEVIADGKHTVVIGPDKYENTRVLLVMVFEKLVLGGHLYAFDPHQRIQETLRFCKGELPDGLPEKFTITYVKKLTELPSKMKNKTLLIDNGRGYFALIENEKHFTSEPGFVFSTVQIIRSLDNL